VSLRRIAGSERKSKDWLADSSLSIEWIRMPLAHDHDVVFWSLAAIQLLGLVTCFATRLVEATRHASPCRHLFVVSLIAVGGATMAAMYCGSSCWVSCGATLSLMSVGATIDFRGQIESSAF